MRTETSTLLDEVLPQYDFRSRHDQHVLAPAGEVAVAVERYDFARDASPFVRLLFRLRGLRIPSGSISEVLTGSGFTLLAERPGEELVVGTTGRFWALRERANMEAPLDLEHFRAFDRHGWARAVMSIRVEPRADGSATLLTETRVQCLGGRARRRFAGYWAFINVFSGWIRRDLLRGIARIAEREAS